MKFRSIEIEHEQYGSEKGKYKCRICFNVNEDVTVYANADEVITAELIKVLIPVFEKITNQKFEDINTETETFLKKWNLRKRTYTNE